MDMNEAGFIDRKLWNEGGWGGRWRDEAEAEDWRSEMSEGEGRGLAGGKRQYGVWELANKQVVE